MIGGGARQGLLTFLGRRSPGVVLLALGLLAAPAAATGSILGDDEEIAACTAWDIHLRYLVEQRQRFGTLTEGEDRVILDEITFTSRLCDRGGYKRALDRYAALFALLSGEDDERDAD